MGKKPTTPVEMKLNAIKSVLDGEQSLHTAGKELGVSCETIRRWIQNYQVMGYEGLERTRDNSYSALLKQAAVYDYLFGEGSYMDICKKHGIRSTTQLRRWVLCYNNQEELKSSKSGGKAVMSKGRKTTFEERIMIVAYCIEHGHDYSGTSAQFQVSYQQVYSWTKKFESGGSAVLRDRRGN